MTTDADAKETLARHRPWEDALAILMGTLYAAVGIEFFRQSHLATGGTAGVAFLIHYASGFGVGPVLFVLNLPFYAFGWITLGREFTIKSFIAVGLLSLESVLMPHFLRIDFIDPLFAAVAGGFLVGIGLLSLIRHKASLGGIGILGAFVQEKLGWRAGKFQMAVDSLITAAAFFVLNLHDMALSVAGAVVLNLVMAVNHKPGRYNGY
ncbi:YitT family protein [Oryzibacter oryziterrae]|uniref:YitT family protein n=1 Tax=Oryzibacter oryziterrae TaxID=2766474 RepID=UPI001F371CC0|nr:YitT family protein [Oryzibacter oryziterrae]